MVRVALVLPPDPGRWWELAKQIGVTDAVIHPIEFGDGQTRWTYDDLRGLQNWLETGGLSLSVVEGSVPVSDRIHLEREGHNEDITEFKQFLRDYCDLIIPVVAYDWMAGARWARTQAHIKARGGSLVISYTNVKMRSGPTHKAGETTHEDLWEALKYFLAEVEPVAEAAGVKFALHPDDPSQESIRDISRIITSMEAYNRVFTAYNSEYNGITFCQGDFTAMGADIPKTINHFGDHIYFVHFRCVQRDANRFVETWHDNGPTDMLAAMRAYREIGFNGPMRPNYVPTMVDEDNSNPGYHTKGRLFAIGYMEGLLEQTETTGID